MSCLSPLMAKTWSCHISCFSPSTWNRNWHRVVAVNKYLMEGIILSTYGVCTHSYLT